MDITAIDPNDKRYGRLLFKVEWKNGYSEWNAGDTVILKVATWTQNEVSSWGRFLSTWTSPAQNLELCAVGCFQGAR